MKRNVKPAVEPSVAGFPAQRRGFTLIELLVVVAIISILASIAVPNFLDAQTRAKVTRTKADMRTIIIALETYCTDNGKYPVRRNTQATYNTKDGSVKKAPYVPEADKRLQQMSVLTTPIAYITTFPIDVFESHVPPPNNIIDYFDSTQMSWMINDNKVMSPERKVAPTEPGWYLVSVGPDGYLGVRSEVTNYGWPFILQWGGVRITGGHFINYDPTNGTISWGNIFGSQNNGFDKAGQYLHDKVPYNPGGY